jgi:hypothetical protein
MLAKKSRRESQWTLRSWQDEHQLFTLCSEPVLESASCALAVDKSESGGYPVEQAIDYWHDPVDCPFLSQENSPLPMESTAVRVISWSLPCAPAGWISTLPCGTVSLEIPWTVLSSYQKKPSWPLCVVPETWASTYKQDVGSGSRLQAASAELMTGARTRSISGLFSL